MQGNEQFADTFHLEAYDLLNEIEQAILDLEENTGDMEAVNRLFRAMHTIKGSGAMFGFDLVSGFTHHIETLLESIRDGEIAVTREIIDLILASSDQIRLMLDNPENGTEIRESIVSRLTDLQGIEEEPAPAMAPQEIVPKQGEIQPYRIIFHPKPGIMMNGLDPAILLRELCSMGVYKVRADISSVPLLRDLDPAHCYLGWEICLETAADIDDIRDVFIFLDDENGLDVFLSEDGNRPYGNQNEPIRNKDSLNSDDENDVPRLGELLVQGGMVTSDALKNALDKQKRLGEILVEEGVIGKKELSSVLEKQHNLAESKRSRQSESVRVPSERLDKLINLVGELVITQARLSQESGRINDLNLNAPVEDIDRLTSELRDTVLNIRMLPIGSIFSKFRRVVRDLSCSLEKEIEFQTTGEETELDKTLIENLDNPLVHLIRNAVDHGIEKREERLRKNKPLKGCVRLTAEHRGAKILIRIEDDGKGLDKEALIRKAREKNLIDTDTDLSESEAFALIFRPGFSTAESVTDVSGRGVGMDVVKKDIEKLHGQISIQSEPGKGTTFIISLPLTLSIIDGLMVEVKGNRYIIPTTMVEECLELRKNTADFSETRNVFSLREEMISLIPLREFFHFNDHKPEREQIVVVSNDDIRAGISVDRIIGDHQAVIKSLGKLSREVEGISGATILGDGSVALIIDIQSVLESAGEGH